MEVARLLATALPTPVVRRAAQRLRRGCQDKRQGSAIVLTGLHVVCVAIGSLGCGTEPAARENVAEVQGAFSNEFGGEDCVSGVLSGSACLPDHETITFQGLGFLRTEIQYFLARQNALFDACNVSNAFSSVSPTLCSALGLPAVLQLLPANLLYGADTAYAHFDNCTFNGSASRISLNYQLALTVAMDDIPPFSCPAPNFVSCYAPATGADALSYFAAVLHTMQDFYAHTNWVELGHGAGDLFDNSLGLPGTPSPSGVYVADGGHLLHAVTPTTIQPMTILPNDYLNNPQDYPSNVRPFGQSKGSWIPALISGVTTEALLARLLATTPQDCPEIVGAGKPDYITHGALAKDNPDLHQQQYQTARLSAVLQTTHEWCRLMNLVYNEYGANGTQHLCKQWVASPSEANLACQSLQLPPAATCCPTGQTNCNGTCVDLDSDAQNCGSCGRSCNANEACSTGVCCPGGQTSCGGTCLDLNSDPQNCGSCGNACNANEACSAGTCCPGGQTGCGGTCIPDTCTGGQVLDPSTCTCACPGGAVQCGPSRYTYTGNQFLYIGGCCGVSNVSGYFTVPSALAPNTTYNNLASTIITYSFTDGRYTWTPSNYPGGPVSPFNISNEFFVTTDAQGHIVSWQINLVSDNPAGEISTQSADFAAGGGPLDSVNVYNNYDAYSYAPGNPNGEQGVQGAWQ
jgi:hypothetical protein